MSDDPESLSVLADRLRQDAAHLVAVMFERGYLESEPGALVHALDAAKAAAKAYAHIKMFQKDEEKRHE